MATVSNGLLAEREIDVSLQRIYEKAFQLGVLDQTSGGANPNPYTASAS
eukprot:COSAG01_NODE_4896_length_4645_cov_2.519798_5_plen_49_part_00